MKELPKLYLAVTEINGSNTKKAWLLGGTKPVFDAEERIWSAELEIDLPDTFSESMPWINNMEEDQLMEIEIVPVELIKMKITYEKQTFNFKGKKK